jgi:hypothetical protein
MTSIFSYGQWILITSRGTSGDQVGDILASWQADAYKMLEACNKVEADCVQKERRIAELEIENRELRDKVEALENRDIHEGYYGA